MMADLVLHYGAPFGESRKFWLRDGESVTVGGSYLADYCIEYDPSIEPVHYAVGLSKHVARVCNLNTESGIYLNGNRAEEHELRDGDRILAGQTEFVVALHPRLRKPAFSASSPKVSSVTNWGDFCIDSQANGWARLSSDKPEGLVEFAKGMIGKLNVFLVAKTDAVASLPSSWSESRLAIGDQRSLLTFQDERDLAAVELVSQQSECTIFGSTKEPVAVQRRLRSTQLLQMQVDVVLAQLTKGPAQYLEMLLSDFDAVLTGGQGQDGPQAFVRELNATPWEQLGCGPPDLPR